MTQTKYIILPESSLTHDLETPILFPAFLLHAIVAAQFAQFGVPVAAGFASRRDAKTWICEGFSDSLGLASRGRVDAELLEAML